MGQEKGRSGAAAKIHDDPLVTEEADADLVIAGEYSSYRRSVYSRASAVKRFFRNSDQDDSQDKAENSRQAEMGLPEKEFATYMEQSRSGNVSSQHGKVQAEEHMSITREEIDAKDRAVEARMEASEARISASISELRSNISRDFGEMSTKIQVLDSKVASLPSRWSMIGTVVGTGFAVFGALLAILSFGGDRFDAGIGLGGDVLGTQKAIESIAAENARQTEEIGKLAANIRQLVDAAGGSGKQPDRNANP